MNTGILFPGQGSQCAQMGRDLAENDQQAMEIWKKAERISGLPLRGIYWEGNGEEMEDTRALQPALTCVNYTLWQALRKEIPVAVAGHSLGEFSALVCAGVLGIDDVLTATTLRGRLMHECDPEGKGGMVACVKLTEDMVAGMVEEVAKETGELVCLANYNTPNQTVVSGTKKAIEVVMAKAKASKGRAIMLKVRGAFHSPMMQEANQEFVQVLRKLDWKPAQFPVFCNLDGEAERAPDRLLEKLCRQMVSSVQWVTTVRNQYAMGVRHWLEVGPKSLLAKMVTACLSDVSEAVSTAAVTDLESVAQRNEE